jgi:hypothetical protein
MENLIYKTHSPSRPPALQHFADEAIGSVTFRTIPMFAIGYFQQFCLTLANNLTFHMHLPLRSITPTRTLHFTHLEASIKFCTGSRKQDLVILRFNGLEASKRIVWLSLKPNKAKS